MKNFSRILAAILLIIVMLFNTVSCDLLNVDWENINGIGDIFTDPDDNKEDEKDDGKTDGEDDEKNDGVKDDPYADFGKEYPCITVAEALDIAEGCTSVSSEKYYIVATITDIANLKKGEMTVSDETGSILLYGTTDADGAYLTGSNIQVGDVVLVYGPLLNYKGYTPEFKDAKILDWYTPGDSDLPDENDPYVGVDADDFYANYCPATSYEDANYRSKHGLLSGTLGVQDQEPTISDYQPKSDGKFIRNNEYLFSADGNTYYVVDCYGEVVMEIYKGGAYIMLEEVAAYVFAFGEPPANQTSSKETSPTSSKWGKHLRLNNTYFSGDTSRYPYEPVLPGISGCGGNIRYYEMDIGTTGTDCDPRYTAALYNNGYSITRGAARIVYTYEDTNRNRIIDLDERYVFYTYNHYNDFQEYLNYFGGWGEMFGNITGGGSISSKYDYNPTPYVPVVHASLKANPVVVVYYYVPKNEYTVA